MQDTKSSQASPALVAPAAEPHVLDRVIAIAPAPLLPGEKNADYASLAQRIVDAAKPQDTIEELLSRDVIDLSWEILRLRRAKAGILKTSMNTGVKAVLDAVDHGPPMLFAYRTQLSEKWVAGDNDARKEVQAMLDKAGLSIEDVTARTLESKLDSFERLDRMLASAEARRNNALREIDRHRSAVGAAVRRAIDEAEDGRVPRHRNGRSDRGGAELMSIRRRLANQANAKASTGPKARAGKARSAQNALRHGLSIPVSNDPALSPHAEAIARQIAGPHAKAEALEQARRIGEARVDLNRVHALRMALVADPFGDPNYQPLSVIKRSVRIMMAIDKVKHRPIPPSEFGMFESLINPKQLEGLEKLAAILEDRATELARLDRYERRTRSRLKSAIRGFNSLRASRLVSPEPEASSISSGVEAASASSGNESSVVTPGVVVSPRMPGEKASPAAADSPNSSNGPGDTRDEQWYRENRIFPMLGRFPTHAK